MFFIGNLLSGLTRMASLIGTICVGLMMLHVTVDVIGRYLFNAPLIGTIVIVGHYYMIILVFMALGMAEEKRAHISVELLTDLMPRSVQGWLSVFSGLLTTAVFCLLAIGGFKEAMKKTKYGASMEQGTDMIDVWQSYWMVPLGAGLIALIAIYKVIVTLTGSKSGLNEKLEGVEVIHE